MVPACQWSQMKKAQLQYGSVRGPPKGSSRGCGRLGRGSGLGGSGLALAWSPRPGAAPPPPDLGTSLQPSSPRKRAPPGLPGNDAPGCIATRIRVPGLFRPLGARTPPHSDYPGLRGSAWCRLQRLLSPLPVRCPAFRPRPALTFLRPLLSFTCDFAETRHQTRASTRGVGLPSPHAQGGMSSETSRPSSQSKPVPGAHAPRFIYCVSFSPPQAFPPREEWDRKFQQGTEVSGWKGEIKRPQTHLAERRSSWMRGRPWLDVREKQLVFRGTA
ncbi:uncharacterized protein LOC112135420 [Pongo abelii]|uniref:uncharacterized protein LOC112135420 n=1 Tax=Pongo abelii TaxID=9601 RepID=UPI0030046FE4